MPGHGGGVWSGRNEPYGSANIAAAIQGALGPLEDLDALQVTEACRGVGEDLDVIEIEADTLGIAERAHASYRDVGKAVGPDGKVQVGHQLADVFEAGNAGALEDFLRQAADGFRDLQRRFGSLAGRDDDFVQCRNTRSRISLGMGRPRAVQCCNHCQPQAAAPVSVLHAHPP